MLKNREAAQICREANDVTEGENDRGERKVEKINSKGKKEVAYSLEEVVRKSEILLFSIPMFRGGGLNIAGYKKYKTEEVGKLLKKGQKIFGGCIPYEIKKEAKKKEIPCYDYMEDESIAMYNSIATAEGAIAEIIRTFPYNLHGEKVLILGYGRCGKTLAGKLSALDARVTICVRRKEVAMEAYALGNEILFIDNLFNNLKEEIPKYSIVINTIPERIFDTNERKVLGNQANTHKKIRFYELASYPYSMDIDAAKQEGVLLEVCGSLPGKYSPVSSAMILRDYIKGLCL